MPAMHMVEARQGKASTSQLEQTSQIPQLGLQEGVWHTNGVLRAC